MGQFVVISLENVDGKNSLRDLKKIRKGKISFFKEGPGGELELSLGGYVKISAEFAEELLSLQAKDKYLGELSKNEIDVKIIEQAVQASGQDTN